MVARIEHDKQELRVFAFDEIDEQTHSAFGTIKNANMRAANLKERSEL